MGINPSGGVSSFCTGKYPPCAGAEDAVCAAPSSCAITWRRLSRRPFTMPPAKWANVFSCEKSTPCDNTVSIACESCGRKPASMLLAKMANATAATHAKAEPKAEGPAFFHFAGHSFSRVAISFVFPSAFPLRHFPLQTLPAGTAQGICISI